LITYVPCIY
jgi:hypothetical protein